MGVIELTPDGLTPADVIAVARGDARVVIGAAARAAMARSAAVVDELAASDDPAYGISTGFGSLAMVRIPADARRDLQRALIRSHAAGIGPAIEPEVVRAMMLLRVRTLAMGCSGARPEVADAIVALLNAGLTPVVPEHGSLGASGDLAPLAHCALVLIGEGEVVGPDGAPRPSAPALAEAGIEPVELGPKEGLALINGTDGMLGMLVLGVEDLRRLLQVADITAAMSVEALLGTDRAFAEDLVALRPQPGQAESAANLRALLADSEIVAATAKATRGCRTPTRCGARRRWPARPATHWTTPGALPARSCDRRSTTRWCSPTGASSRAATSTARRSGTRATSWRSRPPTSARSPSGAPTGCSTQPARMACRHSWPPTRASTRA